MSTTKKPLYLALAELMQRQRNLANRFLDTAPLLDQDHHLNMKADIEDEIERLVKEHMPSGSGFDAGTTLDTDMSDSSVYRYPGRLSFKTSFHHMDEHGGYDGWTEHMVHATPDWSGFHLVVTGRDRKQIKDYIGETFHHALMAEVEVTDIPPKPEGWKPEEPKPVRLVVDISGGAIHGVYADRPADVLFVSNDSDDVVDFPEACLVPPSGDMEDPHAWWNREAEVASDIVAHYHNQIETPSR